MRNLIETNLCMVRGDTLAFLFELVPSIGENTYILDSAYFSVKENVDDEEYVFQKRLDNGISLINDNTYRVKVEPNDTYNLDPGIYNYDLQITLNEEVQTILKGKLKIENDITREEA